MATILSEGNLVDSLEELYRGVENLVRENKGPELYEMLQNSCRTFVAQDLRRKVEKEVVGSTGVGGDGGVRAVECIESAWGKWTSQLVSPDYSDLLTQGLIRSIFYYLDRAHILTNPKLSSIT